MKGENFVNDGKQLVYHEQENGKKDTMAYFVGTPWRRIQIGFGRRYPGVVECCIGIDVSGPFFSRSAESGVKGEAYFEVTKDVKRPFQSFWGIWK